MLFLARGFDSINAFQPRSQDLSSLHPKGSEGGKTLVQAGHVSTKKGKVTKKKTKKKTPKKIYAASSNPTSSCRVCKSVGDFAHCKNLFGKANCPLPVAEEEIYGSSLQRRKSWLPLRKTY